ncbi:peptidoglycan DD-metalloendopeptidase family protein [Aestuariibacter sp. A3R04]|uniref:peptidoglycan DD-metalloendopeptidase family protein n=1 Tax=Aestuariibacter sp. A3R04 TaxID=2841571 RepID=UPI001C09EB6D|nr:peptidoglycan DD-metalloendopeptidase family protein [Aestuariibacter sp. A3R04]MBU3021145.1 peptidoglycan DD-metalloendopeptidase family protein [Aestuariibacter sp. A3R04]
MLVKRRSLALIVVFFVIILTGCSNRNAPAPVTLLNSQPEKNKLGSVNDTYVVKKGDTLFAIAWYTGNDYRDLANYNDLSAPYAIFPGQTLKLNAAEVVKKKPHIKKEPYPKVQEKTGTTTENYDKRSVDRPPTRAYDESEINVNNQAVTVVKPLTDNAKKPTRRGFAEKVSKWYWPSSGNIISTFDNSESGNKGIDISAQRGSPIFAAADGKVVYVGNALRGYGNLIIIKHTDALLSAYAHNDEFRVKEQQWVSGGQQIATMGDSGADRVKLHFEVRYRGKSLDPLRYLPKK